MTETDKAPAPSAGETTPLALIRRMGWNADARLSIHSVCELMTRYADEQSGPLKALLMDMEMGHEDAETNKAPAPSAGETANWCYCGAGPCWSPKECAAGAKVKDPRWDSAPAPAPSAGETVTITRALLHSSIMGAARLITHQHDTALRITQEAFASIDVLAAAPTTGETCQTCGGHGLIGGFINAESGYDAEPCPDCNAPAPSAGETVLVPRELIDRFPEINPSNYDHDEACALNAWGCEVATAAAPTTGETTLELNGVRSDDKKATLHLRLIADSDYDAEGSYRVSANQWTEILRICEDALIDRLAAAPTTGETP